MVFDTKHSVNVHHKWRDMIVIVISLKANCT